MFCLCKFTQIFSIYKYSLPFANLSECSVSDHGRRCQWSVVSSEHKLKNTQLVFLSCSFVDPGRVVLVSWELN